MNAGPPEHEERASVSKPSFPDRARRRRRTPLTPQMRAHRARALRHAAGGALLALALVALVVLHDVPIAALLTSLTLVTIALVVVDPGKHLLATIAPLPDVHTQPVTGGDLLAEVSTARISLPDHELALAGAVGVYRIGRHSLAGQTAAARAIPQVQA